MLRVVIVCVVVVTAVEGAVREADPAAPPSCVYENTTYPAGARFSPEPCLSCRCPHHGGRARCAVQDCMSNPACLRVDYSEDACCGRCALLGCLTPNGALFAPGDVVSSSECETCVCPRGGGSPHCSGPRCPRVSCVDAIRREGDCCDTCPNGSNCWLNDKVIPAGQVVRLGSCNSCTCPPAWAPKWITGRRLQAICTDTCEHSKNKHHSDQ